MAPSNDRKREDNGPIDAGDLPPRGHKVCREHDDHREHEKADDERQPETAQDARDLDEEVGPLDLFLRRPPRDVVREEVREERLGQVNRQAAEEKEAVGASRPGGGRSFMRNPISSLMR
jgi:hypothetical protein